MYLIHVVYCPIDPYLRRPQFESGRGAVFLGSDFAFSLHGGVWPRYMIVEIEGIVKRVPNAHGTQWTVGPLALERKPQQGLFEYGGRQRVIATAVGSSYTLRDITEMWEKAQEN